MIWVDKLRDKIQSWLEIRPAIQHQYIIDETLDYKGNAIKNKIWYRGDSAEIEQLYKQIPNKEYMFWASVPSANMQIRKIHTGLPSMIVDVLVSIVLNNLNDFDFGNAQDNEFWESVVKENKLKKVFERALKETLYIGDGAFKLSFDPVLSDFPIVEFYSGEKIDIMYERGRMKEVVFKTEYKENDTVYVLHEVYGYGYIYYQLKNAYGQPVDMKVLKQTRDLKPVAFDKALNMAVPLMFFESSRWEGRGQSIFDRKCDDFDAFDEVWSQWMDAVRMGRAKEYLPDNLIPRSADGGYLLKPNPFDNRFITTKGHFAENGEQPKAEVVQPNIPHESYLASYITALDLCLQGLISPSTLGIDMKKLDNADAQREKEKATLYTRGSMIEALEETLPHLVEAIFQAYHIWVNKPYKEVKIDVDFGEYANPSFEAQVETVTKARTATIMSVDAAVEELYGDSKDEAWKQEEIQRIKEELGIAELNEPMIGNVPAFNFGGANHDGKTTNQRPPVPDDQVTSGQNNQPDQKDPPGNQHDSGTGKKSNL